MKFHNGRFYAEYDDYLHDDDYIYNHIHTSNDTDRQLYNAWSEIRKLNHAAYDLALDVEKLERKLYRANRQIDSLVQLSSHIVNPTEEEIIKFHMNQHQILINRKNDISCETNCDESK